MSDRLAERMRRARDNPRPLTPDEQAAVRDGLAVVEARAMRTYHACLEAARRDEAALFWRVLRDLLQRGQSVVPLAPDRMDAAQRVLDRAARRSADERLHQPRP